MAENELIKARQPKPPARCPRFAPEVSAEVCQRDLDMLSNCLYYCVYIWRKGEAGGWFFPISVGRTYISGYRAVGTRWEPWAFRTENFISFY
ncbi:MAG: hypothetical protein LBS62_03565 [Clostridiales bacterium]|jgi:hypothetical protein|nr:hypothetical protein [Clostridiales bacterium]